MSDTADDFDGISSFLRRQPVIGPQWHAALTALVAERDSLRAELAAAIKQRDEARREVCEAIAWDRLRSTGTFDRKRVAIERGWDCFAQQEGGGA